MNYFIKRGDKEYGPYSLANLQLYVQQGNISRDDLARSEGLETWVPVWQVIGNITATPSPSYGTGLAINLAPQSTPPNLHWALLLLLSICTVGIFGAIWLFVQAVWARKVQPESKGLYYLLGYLGCCFVAPFLSAILSRPAVPLLELAGLVLFIMGEFAIKSDIQEYYSAQNLSLSGAMTFLFAPYYFQYHFNRINRTQRTQVATA